MHMHKCVVCKIAVHLGPQYDKGPGCININNWFEHTRISGVRVLNPQGFWHILSYLEFKCHKWFMKGYNIYICLAKFCICVCHTHTKFFRPLHTVCGGLKN